MNAPASTNVAPTAFRHVAPMLPVADVERAAAHYRERFGFIVVGVWKDVPYAVVRRDGVEIHFRGAEAGPSNSIYVYVDDVDATYRELLDRGNSPISPPVNQSYGLRDFGIRDLDGHLIMFSSPSFNS